MNKYFTFCQYIYATATIIYWARRLFMWHKMSLGITFYIISHHHVILCIFLKPNIIKLKNESNFRATIFRCINGRQPRRRYYSNLIFGVINSIYPIYSFLLQQICQILRLFTKLQTKTVSLTSCHNNRYFAS